MLPGSLKLPGFLCELVFVDDDSLVGLIAKF